jgi:hypothetical protein
MPWFVDAGLALISKFSFCSFKGFDVTIVEEDPSQLEKKS